MTLAERIKKNFYKIKLKKATVKVPRLKIQKEKQSIQRKPEAPNSSIVSIILKAAVENAKKDAKEKTQAAEGKTYKLKEDKPAASGGYGTVSKNYGASPNNSYVDYEKIFSYLGKFRAKGAYEDFGSPVEFLNKSAESGSFVLADKDSMDKIGRFDKYMKSPVTAIQTMALSLVPIAGLSSGEWEEIKNLMRFDPVVYTLKSKTA